MAERKVDGGSYYLPDATNTTITLGLASLRQEGHDFWTSLRATSANYFKSAFEDTEVFDDSFCENEDILSDYDTSDCDD